MVERGLILGLKKTIIWLNNKKKVQEEEFSIGEEALTLVGGEGVVVKEEDLIFPPWSITIVTN